MITHQKKARMAKKLLHFHVILSMFLLFQTEDRARTGEHILSRTSDRRLKEQWNSHAEIKPRAPWTSG